MKRYTIGVDFGTLSAGNSGGCLQRIELADSVFGIIPMQ